MLHFLFIMFSWKRRAVRFSIRVTVALSEHRRGIFSGYAIPDEGRWMRRYTYIHRQTSCTVLLSPA